MGTTSIETAAYKSGQASNLGGAFTPPGNLPVVSIITLLESVPEGVDAVFQIKRDVVFTVGCAVSWRIENPLDVSGLLPPFTGVALFNPGDSLFTLPLPSDPGTGQTHGDRTARVVLEDAVGCLIDPTRDYAEVVLLDSLPTHVAISFLGAESIVEGDSGSVLLQFRVTRTGSPINCSVSWTREGTVTDEDLLVPTLSGAVYFTGADTVQDINFALVGDNLVESPKTLAVTLRVPQFCTILVPTAFVIIIDDDLTTTIFPKYPDPPVANSKIRTVGYAAPLGGVTYSGGDAGLTLALAAALPGDHVRLGPGTYAEHRLISRSGTLGGGYIVIEPRDHLDPIITGQWQITGDYVWVTGFNWQRLGFIDSAPDTDTTVFSIILYARHQRVTNNHFDSQDAVLLRAGAYPTEHIDVNYNTYTGNSSPRNHHAYMIAMYDVESTSAGPRFITIARNKAYGDLDDENPATIVDIRKFFYSGHSFPGNNNVGNNRSVRITENFIDFNWYTYAIDMRRGYECTRNFIRVKAMNNEALILRAGGYSRQDGTVFPDLTDPKRGLIEANNVDRGAGVIADTDHLILNNRFAGDLRLRGGSSLGGSTHQAASRAILMGNTILNVLRLGTKPTDQAYDAANGYPLAGVLNYAGGITQPTGTRLVREGVAAGNAGYQELPGTDRFAAGVRYVSRLDLEWSTGCDLKQDFQRMPIRSGRNFASGPSGWWDRLATDLAASRFAAEENDVELLDGIVGSSKGVSNSSVATWLGVMGRVSSVSAADDFTDTQYDWRPTHPFGFGNGIAYLPTGAAYPRGSGWLIWQMQFIPTERTTANGDHSIWAEILNGDHDFRWIEMGDRFRRKVDATGHPRSRWIIDAHPGMNVPNDYQVVASTIASYKSAMERIIGLFRQGAGFDVVFCHSPSHNVPSGMSKVGSYASYVPSNVTCLGLLLHASAAVTSVATIDQLFRGTLNSNWYGTDELIATSDAMGLPILFSSWSPTYEVGNSTPVADLFVAKFYDEVLWPLRTRLVGDFVANQNVRDLNGYQGGDADGTAAWQRMVALRKVKWRNLFVAPQVTCIADTLFIATGASRQLTYDPTFNDFTSDGATIFLDTVEQINPLFGSLGTAGNSIVIDIEPTFGGTLIVVYTVVTSTGAVGESSFEITVEGPLIVPTATAVADFIALSEIDLTKLVDVLANDSGTGPLQIDPTGLVQPASGPTISIVTGKIRVTRNSAADGTYWASYRCKLVDGTAVSDYALIQINVTPVEITVGSFTFDVALDDPQPHLIDALAFCSSTSPMEINTITQPTGGSDSAVITGTGSSTKISYTRSSTGAGSYTMTYTARIIANGAIFGTGTITIRITSKWFAKGDRGGRMWPAGNGYYQRNYAPWANAVGRPSAMTMQCMLRGVSDESWELIWGGAHTETLGPNMTNLAKSQTSTSTDFQKNITEMTPDSLFAICVVEMWAVAYSTEGTNNTLLYDYYDTPAGKSKLQAGFIRMGRRLYNMFIKAGWTDTDLFVLRPTHEMNQTNITRVYLNTRIRWRAMTEDFYAWLREGFADANGDWMRIIHSPGSFARIGPYDDWIPQTGNGKVDVLTISYHPSTVPGNNLAGVLQDFWDGNNNEYGATEVLAACNKLGMVYGNPEWGPNFGTLKQDGSFGLVPCPQSDLVVQQFNKFCRALAKVDSIAFECQYNQTMLDTTAYIGTDQAGKDAWARMVGEYKAIWLGQPKGTPPTIDGTNFSVNLTGATVDADPIANCTGSQAVRIKRVVTANGWLTASIVNVGAAARVRIARGVNTTNGTKKVIVEMKLENLNMLFDIEISVVVT